MQPYFELNDYDRRFYAEHIGPGLPDLIFDVHTHLNLPEHVKDVPEERWHSDWAMECGHLLPVDDALKCMTELFPGKKYRIAGFPMPVKEADIPANNSYLAGEQAAGKVTAFMCVRPEWAPEQVEAELVQDGFVGFKPYPDMVSGVKGADISIFDYLPEDQWAILDRNRRAVMLHLPRRGRLADDDNVRELLDIRQRYPNVTIIIAHFGRSFNPVYLTGGLDKLGGGGGFYFDTAAVLNPEVYDIAFDRIDHRSILYGSDMPIVLFRGRRTWTRDMYVNHSSEAFSWNTDREPPEVERTYTLFLYEEVRAILEAAKRAGLSGEEKQDIFRGNALRALGLG